MNHPSALPSSSTRIVQFPPPPHARPHRVESTQSHDPSSDHLLPPHHSTSVPVDEDMEVETDVAGLGNGHAGGYERVGREVNGRGRGREEQGVRGEFEDERDENDEDDDDDDLSIEDDDAIEVHVEVRRHPTSNIRNAFIQSCIPTFLTEAYGSIQTNFLVPFEQYEDVPALSRNVERIWISEASNGEVYVDTSKACFIVHVYATEQAGPNEFGVTTGEDDDEESQVPAASVQDLPSSSFEGLWDSLVYPDDIKPNLLRYIYSTMVFAEAAVDFNVISWNRMVLLHGPPGTGKTSLCRGLAQKLSIRLSNTYTCGKLVEINSHSLFSKWFSESGKLVQKLFSAVHEMTEDERCFVVVMIDEVESLTAARAGAMSGTEPSDAMRVVNALLTQLDKLKTKKNVLVMTTSNIAHAIDSAFVDRADIKLYIGLPPPEAVYWILGSCMKEVSRAGLVKGSGEMLSWRETRGGGGGGDVGYAGGVGKKGKGQKGMGKRERMRNASLALASLAETCQALGMSGRALRKLPLLAHSRYLSSTAGLLSLGGGGGGGGGSSGPGIARFIDAMARVVADETRQRNLIAVRSSTETTATVQAPGGTPLAPGMVPAPQTNGLTIS